MMACLENRWPTVVVASARSVNAWAVEAVMNCDGISLSPACTVPDRGCDGTFVDDGVARDNNSTNSGVA